MDLIEQMVKEKGIDNIDALGSNVLAYAAAELFRDDTVSADFSHKAKGLADAGGTIHRELGRIERTMEKELENINIRNRMTSSNKEQQPPLGEIASMDKIKITVTENGEIKIEGRFAESETVNAEAMAKMSALLQGEMLGQTGNGGESTLITAMRQLRIDHDEEFGNAGFAKTGSVTFDGNKTETFVDAPEAEIAIEKEMAGVVAQAVEEETGVELKSNALEVTEEGRIILKELPPTADARRVREFIDALNNRMGKKNNVISNEELLKSEEPVNRTADMLKELLEELASYEQRTERYYYRG